MTAASGAAPAPLMCAPTMLEALGAPPVCSPGGLVILAAARDTFLRAGQATLVPTGWSVALPVGYEGRLTLAPEIAGSLQLVNTPYGTLDADYVGLSIGAIVRAERDHVVRAGSALLCLSLWPHLPPPGAAGSPVRVVAGACHVGTRWAAGADLRAAVGPVSLGDGARCTIPTDVRLEFDATVAVELRSRSGLALKGGISVVEPRAVRSGEPIAVGIHMRGRHTVVLARGDRIAQVVATLCTASLAPIHELRVLESAAQLPTPDSSRSGGFGSTGTR